MATAKVTVADGGATDRSYFYEVLPKRTCLICSGKTAKSRALRDPEQLSIAARGATLSHGTWGRQTLNVARAGERGFRSWLRRV
jgi:hypothetical protein